MDQKEKLFNEKLAKKLEENLIKIYLKNYINILIFLLEEE